MIPCDSAALGSQQCVNGDGDVAAEESDGGSNGVFLFVLVILLGLKVLNEGLVCLDRAISV